MLANMRLRWWQCITVCEDYYVVVNVLVVHCIELATTISYCCFFYSSIYACCDVMYADSCYVMKSVILKLIVIPTRR